VTDKLWIPARRFKSAAMRITNRFAGNAITRHFAVKIRIYLHGKNEWLSADLEGSADSLFCYISGDQAFNE
jgi:hypothetical protein